MPTGYTAPIYEGKDVSFTEFAWRCARAFSAFIMQRDNSLDAPIMLREEPSPDDAERINARRREVDRLTAMTLKVAAEEAKRDHEAALAAWEESRASCAELRGRYEAMLEQVLAWKPPTPDHEGLRTYMADQLRQSINHDCMVWPPERPEPMEAAEWLGDQIKRALRSLAVELDMVEKERAAAESRNAWVAALVESIGTPPQNDRARGAAQKAQKIAALEAQADPASA